MEFSLFTFQSRQRLYARICLLIMIELPMLCCFFFFLDCVFLSYFLFFINFLTFTHYPLFTGPLYIFFPCDIMSFPLSPTSSAALSHLLPSLAGVMRALVMDRWWTWRRRTQTSSTVIAQAAGTQYRTSLGRRPERPAPVNWPKTWQRWTWRLQVSTCHRG